MYRMEENKLNCNTQLKNLKKDFTNLQAVFTALGDEVRQSILLILMETTCQEGLRVGEITDKVNLSRPAVSHHLKVLREAELIAIRKEGTKNFYSIKLNGKFEELKVLLLEVETFTEGRHSGK